MLDAETKRRIDTARDILVGKVPDPKSQVEQITIALIYKFMDDLDAESEEFGGARKFFAGEFSRYGWAKLMRSGLGGYEMLNLYAEAIAKMPENPGIPPLFRDIFKNAFLPYRNPETLRAFLKIIDEFTYDHSERLGDAFEYLLSVLGSQGDAGQFRTPRHIIDFIVAIVDPKKDETILDPACGTAGFLISSFKHILKSNTDEQGHSTLTPDEKGRLAANFKGYDISPDMVRLSLVNLYLHGFADPHIVEYDTLTSEDRWNEYADVILANPPFMSPKGGIRPHNRFSVQSKRSEVLFVDYMAEHLTPSGRAGIIVPEGIIFQSQTAHKRLRKMLVENYLVAVISLPSGVFQPYSGVKTSILILDKVLAKKTDRIGFFKVENDGFDLGAQRRPIDKNDLPQVRSELAAYLHRLRVGAAVDAMQPVPTMRVAESGVQYTTIEFRPSQGLIIGNEKIAANGEYTLSGERYRENSVRSLLKWPLVKIDELCIVERGASPRPIRDFVTESSDGVNWVKIGDAHVGSKFIFETAERITREGAERSRWVKPGDFVLSNSMSYGRPYIMATDGCIHDGWLLLREKSSRLDKDFLYHILGSDHIFAQFERAAIGGVVNNLNSNLVRNIEIPLPPLDVQEEIVSEIEGYQKVIDGARAVIDNYRPHIPIDPDWPMMELGRVFKLSSGHGLTQAQLKNGPFPVYGGNGRLGFHSEYFVEEPTIVIGRVGAYCGAVHITDPKAWVTDNGLYVTNYEREINQRFLALALTQLELNKFAKVAGQPSISQKTIYECQTPLPPLDTQHAVLAQIKAEESLVGINHDLIKLFEKKIQVTIDRVWRADGLCRRR